MAVNVIDVGYDSTHYWIIAPDKGSKLLVDCGMPGTLGKFIAQLTRKGIVLRELRYLLITHFHPDHAGIAQDLRNAGLELLLFEPQAPFVKQLRFCAKPTSGYKDIVVDGSPVLKPGDSRDFLALAGINGEVVPTPGHSPDSVSLVLDEGMAFTGDLTPPIVMADDDTISRESWQRLQQLGVRTVYPAHGSAPVPILPSPFSSWQAGLPRPRHSG